jgi:translocation and assembly module TamA
VLIVALLLANQSVAQTAPTPPSPPVSAPNAAAVDPELLAPLQPLDQFTVTTATKTNTSAPPAVPDARYGVTITGLTTSSLVRRFRTLSSLMAGRHKVASAEQTLARANQDVKTLETLLRADGYYDAHASFTILGSIHPGAPGTVRITADPGPLYHLAAVTVTGAETLPHGLVPKALGLKPGAPIIAPVIVAAEGDVRLRLPQEGYPFVKLGDHDIVLNPETHTGDYLLPVDPGARARFGSLVIKGQPVFPLRQLEVLPRFHADELYDSRLVEDLRRDLMASGLFATVAVTNLDAGAKTPDGAEVVDIQIQGAPAKPHDLSGSIGYQTGLGATAEVDWTDHNLAPPEGALTLRGVYGTQQSLAGITFQQSDFRLRDQSLQWVAQVSRETLDAYHADIAQVGVTLARTSTPIWQKRWTWSIGAEALTSQETGYDPAVAATVRRSYEIAALPLQVEYDRSDDLLNPTRGYRLSLAPTPEFSLGEGARPYLVETFNGTAYQPILKDVVLAGRLQLGSIFGAPVQNIAPSQRFYAGGGGSVRGFAYQGVGPKDPAGDPIGGVSSTLMSLESRFRFGDYGLVAFIDSGEIYESATPNFSNLRYGAGLGFRYYTSFGPLRVDVATPVGRRPGDSPLGVYISIGQTF